MGIVVKACLLVIRYTLFNWIFWIFTGIVTAVKLYLAWSRSYLICPGRINGKTAIVTGANTGLGFEISRTLASRGARVIMACRNMGSAFQAKAAIVQETGNSNIEIRQLDLGSLWSIRQFVRGIADREDRLDLLIHCAGVLGVKDCKSNDDIQISWQINHHGPFLLTTLLMDILKRSSPSRVIFSSSTLHHFSKLDTYLDRINEEGNGGYFRTYADTSLATIVTAKHMAAKLNGTGVTVNVANPGFVNVKFRRIKNEYLQSVIKFVLGSFAKTLEEGAATAIMLAVKPELEEVTGKYFSECKISGCLSKHTRDEKIAETIWKQAEQLVGLEDYEKLK